jgi:large subunit ribosomal protein L17
MRHRLKGRKFSRTTSHRIAMARNLTASLLLHERIVTTVEKAKDFRGLAEKVITLGKRGGLHAFRQALAIIPNKPVIQKVFKDIAPRFKDRPGGYTRIIKLGGSRQMEKADGRWVYNRLGDNGRRAIWELVVRAEPKPEAEGKTKEKKAKEEKAAAAT